MCVFTHLRLVKIPRPLVQKLTILHAAESVIYFLIYMNLDHALLLTASATFDAVRRLPLYCGHSAFYYTAASPDAVAVWPIPLHCDRFRSTAAASTPLQLLPLYCGRFRSTAAALRTTAAALPTTAAALRTTAAALRTAAAALRTTAAAPCRNPTSMFRSGVHLWATINILFAESRVENCCFVRTILIYMNFEL